LDLAWWRVNFNTKKPLEPGRRGKKVQLVITTREGLIIWPLVGCLVLGGWWFVLKLVYPVGGWPQNYWGFKEPPSLVYYHKGTGLPCWKTGTLQNGPYPVGKFPPPTLGNPVILPWAF